MGNETSSAAEKDIPADAADAADAEGAVSPDRTLQQPSLEKSAAENFLAPRVGVDALVDDTAPALAAEASSASSMFQRASLLHKATSFSVRKTLGAVESASSAGKEAIAAVTAKPYSYVSYVKSTASGAAASGVAALAAWNATKDATPVGSQHLRQRLLAPMTPADDLQDLCATVCYELNFHEDPRTFKAAMMQAFGADTVRAAILVNQGVLHSRLALVVKDQVALVAWRGSKTPVEWVTDSGFSPSLCHLWLELCDEIQAHGAMMAVIEHDFYVHHKQLLEKIHEFGVERLVFAGHSLGGGLAQIAHLAILGQMHVGKFEKLQVSTVAFAAPMVFYMAKDNVSEAAHEVLLQLFEQTTNWVYHADAAPRMPGHPDFWIPALKDIVSNLARRKIADAGGNRFGKAVTWKLLFGDGRLDILFELFERHAKATVAALRRYRHTSRICLVDPHAAAESEVTDLDHAGFMKRGYNSFASEQDDGEFLAEFHGCLPRNMARTYGFFRLKHLGTGGCIALKGGEVKLASTWGDEPDELYWKRVRVPWYVRPPDGTFKLENKASGKWLAVQGEDLEANEDVDTDEQYWRLVAGCDGAFFLESMTCGKNLGVEGEGDERRITLCPQKQGEHHWKIIRQKKRHSMREYGSCTATSRNQ